MGKTNRPTVLIVDDEQDVNALAKLLKHSGVSAKVRHPEHVLVEDLDEADLVLVDFELETWPERAGLAVSRQPRDGLAVAAVLRRQIHDRQKASPTAFALLTGKFEKLASPLPPEHREHILARITNLEWVFQKA